MRPTLRHARQLHTVHVTVWLGDTVLRAVTLEPDGRFILGPMGPAESSFAVPDTLLGAREVSLVRHTSTGAEVAVPPCFDDNTVTTTGPYRSATMRRHTTLQPGERAILDVGPLTFVTEVTTQHEAPRRRRVPGAWMQASITVVLGLMSLGVMTAFIPESPGEHLADRLEAALERQENFLAAERAEEARRTANVSNLDLPASETLLADEPRCTMDDADCKLARWHVRYCKSPRGAADPFLCSPER